SLEPPPFTAYAVTTDLRREHPTADDDELEYLAFTDAVTSVDGAAPVGAAADVDAEVVTDLLDPAAPVSAVQVASAVPQRQVASFHVADPAAEGVAGALADYLWYDATELKAVVDLLG
ncbi:MAG TPA: hypothetical protein VI110_06150, partial [Lapillicoccus sp.]